MDKSALKDKRRETVIGLLKGMDNIQYTIANTVADIIGFNTCGIEYFRYSTQMRFRQVNDMDIVTDTGAVFGIVITAENGKLRQSADRYTGNIGHEIIRNTIGILADQTAFMCPNGIEIT